MAENTKIQWTDHTFNPWMGCAKVSEGCQNCYAEALMDTRYGRVQWGPNGTRVRTKTWNDPPRWDRQARAAGEKRKVFCASLADVFEDRPDLKPWRSDLFKLIDRCPNLYWLLLTKRPENVRRLWEGPNRENCWLGTSIANQKNADEFIPRLLSCRGLGPVLFLSIEPQIGRVDLSRFLFPVPVVDWVIVGGESRQGGGEPREFNLCWAREIVRQCQEATVPCFVKQMGSRPYDLDELEPDSVGHRPIGRVPLRLADAHGGDWNEWPEDLRVRQCPEGFYPQLVEA
jgi:protein gp37